MDKSDVKFLEIRYADPICTIDLIDDAVIYGTMLGRSGYYSIIDKKFFLLTESEKEQISGVQFINHNKEEFYVAIGDDEVIHFTTSEDNSVPKGQKFKNYDSESQHSSKCEGCFSLLKKVILLRLYLHLPPDKKDLGSKGFKNELLPTEFVVKNVSNLHTDSGQIQMSSYCVPMDFDGKRFLWVDFISQYERYIYLYNFLEKKNTFEKKLSKAFGHISHLFFLPENRYFMVRNYNQCEILNEKFEVIEDFIHIGEEVIASHFWQDKENNITYIVTLDIGGNVNIYDDKIKDISLLFNMYDLGGIKKEHKDRQFFSMDYPYFIRLSKNYLAITTDYGCYIIKR